MIRRLRRHWGAIGGLAAFVYVVALAVHQVLLWYDGRLYLQVNRAFAEPAWRVALCVVLLGTWFHALDGTRRIVTASSAAALGPDDEPRHARWRAVVAFVFGASSVPLVATVLWPLL